MNQNSLDPHQQAKLTLDNIVKGLKTEGLSKSQENHEAVYQVIKLYFDSLSRDAGRYAIPISNLLKSNKFTSIQKKVTDTLAELFSLGLSPNCICEDETPLMCAIKCYDEEIVKILLENGADPNILSPTNQMNALSLAIILNETSILKIILSYEKSDINRPCCHALTPLQLSMNKCPDISKLLIHYGANVDQVLQISGIQTVFVTKPPLIYAIETENLYLATLLLENGEDINQCYGECQNSPLHFAVMQGSVDMLKLLIQFGANVNKRNSRGHTVFGLALHQTKNGKALTETLLAADCSWRKSSMMDVFLRRYPPTHILAYLGYDFHLHILKLLMDKATPSHMDVKYVKPMLSTNGTGNEAPPLAVNSVKSLQISERDLDLPEKENHDVINMLALDKSTALFFAVWGGNLEIAEYLYGIGADPYLTCSSGNLVHAAVMGSQTSVEILQFALQFNFDVNVRNEEGNTPLNLAARLSSDIYCKLLMDHGAYLNVRDARFGETPLSISIYFGFEDNAEALIAAGADPDIPDFR